MGYNDFQDEDEDDNRFKMSTAIKSLETKKVVSILTNAQRKMLAEELGGITPLQILLSIALDEQEDMENRFKACTILMPYMHKKMPVATETLGPTITVMNMNFRDVKDISDADLDTAIAVLDRIGVKAVANKTNDGE